MTVRSFLYGHLAGLPGHDVVLAADFESFPPLVGLPEGVRCVQVPIKRRIDPRRDLGALVMLVSLLRHERPSLVFSQTPKAGLLAMLAAWAVGVPVRVHVFTGQVWATRSGPVRFALKSLDRLTTACASQVLVDSPSQREFLLREGVVAAERSGVIAEGSVSGVDVDRFRRDPAARLRVRSRLGIPGDAFLFLFVGRMNSEKGISELADAFGRLRWAHADAFLLLVGPDEGGYAPALAGLPGVVVHGPTERPEEFFASADVFCLPSHREGFGSVIIEAAACGLPGIGSRIYGISDAIVDGETGLLHRVRDSLDLERCMRLFIDQRDLALQMGTRAMERARLRFSQERVVSGFLRFIEDQLRRVEASGS